jgi:hypothetical protein
MANEAPHLADETHAAGSIAGPITLALLILIGLIAVQHAAPPAGVGVDAPATEFSAARAMRDVLEIAKKPRPLGSAENDRVRGYLGARLQELGLSSEIQTATVARHTEFGPDKWALVNNLTAKLPGTKPTATVLMVAHYDSVPSGPGAADNAASVAAILETIRALKAGPALRNDLVVVFTDGEELGRLGAQGFVDQNPTLRKINVVVLNFAMRGDEGPSIMFQPAPQDLWLTDQLPQGAPFPRRTSISPLLFPAPPRETDLDVFLDAGMDGMTFGALRGVTRFHTELDNVDLLDQRALQDQGMHALSMAQRFGTIDLDDLGGESAASFVRNESQSRSAVWMKTTFGIVVPILLLGLIWTGIRNGQFSIRGIGAGFAIYAIAIVLAVVEARVAWRLTAMLAGWRMLPAGTTYGGFYNSVGAIALVFGTLWAAYELIGRSIRLQDLGAGALVVWMVAAIAMAITTPDGLHPFVWPLLFATVAIRLGADAAGSRSTIGRVILALIAVAPATMIIAPSLSDSADGTQLFTIFGGLATVMLFGWFIPYVDFLTSGRRWMVPAALGAFAIAMFVTGDLASNFDADHPHPDSMFYFLDSDLGHARWVSLDSRPDRFTAQFFQHHVRGGWMSRLSGLTTRDTPTESIPDIARYRDFAFLNRGRTTEGDAPFINAPPPTLKVLDDSTVAGTRTVKMHIASARGASVMWMSVPIGVTVLRSSIDGKSPGSEVTDGWTGWNWRAPATGFDLELKLATPAPFVVTVVDQTDGLPDTPGFTFKPRPADAMPTPFLFFDSTTLVRKTFAIGGEQVTTR